MSRKRSPSRGPRPPETIADLVDPASIVSEEEFISPSGKTYRIIHTNETNAPPPREERRGDEQREGQRMTSLVDRFRRWYEYERDCNAKTLAMLESVPVEARATAEFQKAVDRMAHLVAARARWLHRLGHWPESPKVFPTGTNLTDLPDAIAKIEKAWVEYLGGLDDTALEREFEWVAPDGKRYRWDVEGVLTQVFGHAWYHRGQIAQLVAALGGKAVDTDYILWCKLTSIEEASATKG